MPKEAGEQKLVITMSDKVKLFLIYGIIIVLLLIAPVCLVIKTFPWWAILISALPVFLFVWMRFVGFMNEIESGLLCLILSTLIGMMMPVVDILLKKYRGAADAKPAASALSSHRCPILPIIFDQRENS